MFTASHYDSKGLADIYQKVQENERLSLDDGERILACDDLLAVGSLAHKVRTRLHGKRTYYVINQHINYSNICINGCLFCAFGQRPGSPEGFFLSTEQILAKIQENLHKPITEIHIVGGCHPELPLSYFEDMLRRIKRLRPNAALKAFTIVEIAHFAEKEGISTREVMIRLKRAGLDLIPGGGAEIFSPRVRRIICPRKLCGERWLEITREAHELGIKTNATMLFGHVETPKERLEHLDALRRLQDETGGFLCFIPLPFQPKNTRLENVKGPTAVDELKTIAVSRLMLDNIPHIKAYWVMLTLRLAQLALYFGADDIDGTVMEEKIAHMAGAGSLQAVTQVELERLISEAGFEPVQRDSFFRILSPIKEHKQASF